MKIWLDDERPVPDESWTHCRNGVEAMAMIASYIDRITHISFDHDLGSNVDGYDVARFCELYFTMTGMDFDRIIFTVHSANPVGRKRILATVMFLDKWKKL